MTTRIVCNICGLSILESDKEVHPRRCRSSSTAGLLRNEDAQWAGRQAAALASLAAGLGRARAGVRPNSGSFQLAGRGAIPRPFHGAERLPGGHTLTWTVSGGRGEVRWRIA